jgi:hypothetical protein
MRNLRVLDSIDTGTRIWLLLARANGEQVAGYVERTDHARAISPKDFISIYSGSVLWMPRVAPAKAYGLGPWSAVLTCKPPKRTPPLLAS